MLSKRESEDNWELIDNLDAGPSKIYKFLGIRNIVVSFLTCLNVSIED